MSTQTLPERSAAAKNPFAECRVWERFPCGLQTTCQPVAARGDHELSWSAEIRDLSVGGLGLVLRRRFERGVGLAIEIPESGSNPATTLLGRVVHTTALSGGLWLHGCTFLSQLSEDELKRLLSLGQAESPPAPNGTSVFQPIPDVTLETADKHGKRRLVHRFRMKGTWPLPPGAILKVWFGKTPHAPALLRVQSCVQQAGRWHIRYTFLETPSPEMRQALA